MTSYLIDADSAIYATTAQFPVLRERLAQCEPGAVGLSAISFAEIVEGMEQSKPPTPEALDAFVEVVPIHAFGEDAAQTNANMPFRRARFDRLLAAHALSIGATIITNNEGDLADVPGLKVENWTV